MKIGTSNSNKSKCIDENTSVLKKKHDKALLKTKSVDEKTSTYEK